MRVFMLGWEFPPFISGGLGTACYGLTKALDNDYALIILDLMLPHLDGLEVCKRLRREDTRTPLLMLTAKSEELDKVLGLELGADDYLTKPVGNKELVARVQALLRRADLPSSLGEGKGITYSDGYLTMDIAERKILVDGKRVKLTPTEFRLLALLFQNAERILTHKQLLEGVWGWEYIDDIDSLLRNTFHEVSVRTYGAFAKRVPAFLSKSLAHAMDVFPLLRKTSKDELRYFFSCTGRNIDAA